jgi:guanine deaminase
MQPFAVTGTIVDCPPDYSWNQLRIIERGLLVVDGQGTIVHRGAESDLNEAKEKFDVTEVIELQENNEFLLPGFIDTHIHAPQYPNCGLGLDLELLEWLQKYTYPTEAKFGADLQFARKAYHSVVQSTLNHGTTTAVYYATIDEDASLILAEKAQELGQRAFVGKVNIDRNGPEYYTETTQGSIDATKSFVTKVLDMKDDLVQPIITPRFVPVCSRQLLESLGQFAKEKNVRIQTHLSENKSEIEWVKQLEPTAKNYTDAYAKTGILTDKTILAHGIYLDDSELSVIRDAKAGISHCPNSNNSIRSGNMRVVKYHGIEGLKLGLATDCSGGYSPSMLNAMRFGIATSNTVLLAGEDKTSMNYCGAISLATRGSARVCNLEDKVGGFDVGLQFDALRVRMSNSHDTQLFGTESVHDMIHKFVFLGDDRNLVQVFVKGKCVKNLLC